MSYKCDVCRNPVPPGQPKLRWTVYQKKLFSRLINGQMEDVPVRQIAREVSVCRNCLTKLEHGAPLGKLTSVYQPSPDQDIAGDMLSPYAD